MTTSSRTSRRLGDSDWLVWCHSSKKPQAFRKTGRDGSGRREAISFRSALVGMVLVLAGSVGLSTGRQNDFARLGVPTESVERAGDDVVLVRHYAGKVHLLMGAYFVRRETDAGERVAESLVPRRDVVWVRWVRALVDAWVYPEPVGGRHRGKVRVVEGQGFRSLVRPDVG